MKVQAIIFDNKHFNTSKARAWLKKNKYKPIKRVDKKKNTLRYRLIAPNKKYQYRTIKMGEHIKGVMII